MKAGIWAEKGRLIFVVGPRAEGDKKAPPLVALPEEQAAIREMLQVRAVG